MFRRTFTSIYPSRLARSLTFLLTFILALYGFFYVTYPQEAFSYVPDYLKPIVKTPSRVWNQRAEQVKAAFVHAYHGYEAYAAPSDELRPLSNVSVDNFNGWGVSAVDSLDTMLLMGLQDEYQRARQLVTRINFAKAKHNQVGYFETTIRYLGGLLSAHALTGDKMFLSRAEELAVRLDPVFDSASGLPFSSLNPANGRHTTWDMSILAEIGTLQLEYAYLGKVTGKERYWNRSATVMKAFNKADLTHTGGMLPTSWNLTTGQPIDYHVSVGASADSAHEYLLKLYLLGGKKYKGSLEMYLRTTTHIISNLIFVSPTRHLMYATDTQYSSFEGAAAPSHVYEHLSCFLPGLLALGAHTLPLGNLASMGIDLRKLGNTTTYGYAGRGYEELAHHNLKDIHLWAAEGLAETCWLAYADQPSGLGPDEIFFQDVNWEEDQKPYLWMDLLRRWTQSGGRGAVPGMRKKKPIVYGPEGRGEGPLRDYSTRSLAYLLRPETIESIFILWKVTGDPKWRERGWQMFQAIEKQTKTASGYASPTRVDLDPAALNDDMPSYFLAETLKYFYLLFREEDLIPLDKWVFNTEAHPFPIVDWTKEELERYLL